MPERVARAARARKGTSFSNGEPMNFALVRNGTIENVIVADDAFIAAHGAELAGEGGSWVLLDDSTHVNGQRPGPGWKMATDKAGARQFARPDDV